MESTTSFGIAHDTNNRTWSHDIRWPHSVGLCYIQHLLIFLGFQGK